MRRFPNSSFTALISASVFLNSSSAFGFFQHRDASSRAGKKTKPQDSWEKTVDDLIDRTKKYTNSRRMQKTGTNDETASQLLLELENLKSNSSATIQERNQMLWRHKVDALIEHTKNYMNHERIQKTDSNYEAASWLLSELEKIKLDPSEFREFSRLVDQRLYNPNHNNWREKDFNSGFDNLEFILIEAYQLGHLLPQENLPCEKSRRP